MNPLQAAEFHLSIYHYFLWQTAQEKAKEFAAAQPKEVVLPPAADEQSAADELNGGKKHPSEDSANDEGGRASTASSEAADAGKDGAVATVAAAASAVATSTTEAAAAVTTAARPAPKPNGAGVPIFSPKVSERCQALVDCMLEQFPQQLANFPHHNPIMLNATPPIIGTLYVDFPRLQSEVFAARHRIVQLESMVQPLQHENARLDREVQSLKRKGLTESDAAGGDAPSGAARKRPRWNAAANMTNIASRPDVPDGRSCSLCPGVLSSLVAYTHLSQT